MNVIKKGGNNNMKIINVMNCDFGDFMEEIR